MVDPAVTAMLISAATSASTVAANAVANAVKASGAIIKLKSEEFARILSKTTDPLIIVSVYGYKQRKTRYLLSWKGFIFFCETTEQMILPNGAEIVTAKKIWVPG